MHVKHFRFYPTQTCILHNLKEILAEFISAIQREKFANLKNFAGFNLSNLLCSKVTFQ